MLFNKSVAACVAALSLALLASCSKKADSANPVFGNLSHDQVHVYTDTSGLKVDRTHLNELFNSLRILPQTFTVQAGQYVKVHGANGTRLIFYPGSFKDAAGNVISSGTVQIELIEMYRPGNMIANRASTTVDGALLRSGGQVEVIASMNNQPVYANKYGIGFKQSAASVQPMSLYYGNTVNADSIVDWTQAVQATGNNVQQTVMVNDSANGSGNYYLFDSCTSFQWVNCDHIANELPQAQLTNVRLNTGDTSLNCNNTSVYIVFPAYNCVSYFNQYDVTNHVFNFSQHFYLPIGVSMTIVAISNKNGSYYYATQSNVTVTANLSLNLTMQPQTLPFIANALLTL